MRNANHQSALKARVVLISAVRTTPLQQSFAIWGARKFGLECAQLLDDGGELLADGSQAVLDAQGKSRVLGARNQPVGEHSAQALGQDLG